ncbi:Factor VIII intron 22 protein [Armadillidium nasatum]|uniref:Factor VIII intron 22 protein n=1 Tax=Armadillidium nasatum TaxID=96803 RepID=A0A5N5SVI4_9CRUS|nr:Factor VIII intron 22 protein [Armadillidium nasatum]
MESIPNNNDFLQNYRNISHKIKKRFLRKPNVAEASEDFSKLAHDLTDCEAWPQAGLCCLAVAQCEQSLANPMTEVASMIEAGRKFMKAEQVNQSLLCPNYGEHVITAVHCYQLAIKLYKDQEKPALAASLAMELSQSLCELGRSSEALGYLEDAASLLVGSPFEYLYCLGEIASCKIELGDLNGALKEFSKILSYIDELEGKSSTASFEDILTRSEICVLLLLLTLQPLPHHMKQEHSRLLEKYSYLSSELQSSANIPFDDSELLILLQSLVLACQTKDVDAIDSLAPHLSSKMSGQPLHLLHILLTEMKRS